MKTTTPATKARLEELREILRSESISYGELHELQSLAAHIEPGDVELLEAAGVPEFPERKPGEWYIGAGIRHTDTIGINTGVYDGGEWQEETIAEVLPGCPREKMEAQANLMVAAPAMLAALNHVISCADNPDNEGDTELAQAIDFRMIRDAITKATKTQ